MGDSIGQFTEEVFETRHAVRNALKRRLVGIRSTAKREESVSIAFASCMNAREPGAGKRDRAHEALI